MPVSAPSLGQQVAWLFLLAVPIACVAWTVTHEEVFREPRDYCVRRSQEAPRLLQRKFFYLFTCEYCFSHYVTAGFLWLTGYRLLLDDWRGVVIALFALVWVANQYMSFFARLRIGIKVERLEAEDKERQVEGNERSGPTMVGARRETGRAVRR
ncbi:MAG TPA: hypothetical protein VFX50_11325 [Gemmatimonadales bacterium]|nr:hypothetical protein [Gemmatimonadales bacterium]